MNYKVYTRNQEFNILEQVLYNRGIVSPQQMREFIAPDEKVVQSEYFLSNIEEAAKELCRNLAHQNKIYIQVDSDCDGYTSSAVLINYLHRIFPATVENNIIYNVHEDKHHGINVDAIPEGVKLVIAPDSSSNENDLHKKLSERGIHIIILDHHQAIADESDPSIIVNNQMCNYPNKALSGVGIVYKFCKVLDNIFHVSYADDYLDLVSLGMTADMMDLREPETHYYIIKGAENIKNIFYNKMIEKQEYSMKGVVNPFTISWYIAPLINAVTRSGTLDEKKMVFEAFLDYQAIQVIPSTKRGAKGQDELKVEQALRLVTNIKSRQEKTKKDILDKILPTIDAESTDPILVILFPEPIDENLNGLLANQLMGMFHKPTFVLNGYYDETKDNDLYFRGSARGFESAKVHDWRKYVEDSGYAEYAEGHEFAFGVSFEADSLKYFIEKTKQDLGTDNQSFYQVDFSYLTSDKFDKDILDLGHLQGLWGQNVQEPLVVIEKVALTQNDIQLLGKGTLKITIPGHSTSCIKFGGEDAYNDLIKYLPEVDSRIYVSLLGTCAVNEYYGNEYPQIKLKDYEITGVMEWYF